MKRIIFNVFSPLFVKIRYYKKKDPFSIFHKIIKPTWISNDSTNKDIILITPIRISPISNLFEGLLGKFYELKGKNVKLLMCNQSVRYCDNFTKFDKKAISCALCNKEQKRFVRLFKLKSINANNCVSQDEINYINKIINERNFKSREDFYFDGVDLYDSITSAVMRYTLKSEIDEYELIKKYAFTSFFYSRTISNINKVFCIKTLISSHGIYSTWGSIMATCKKLNIYTIIWGRGYIGQGKLLFGINNSYHQDFIDEDPLSFKNIEISKKEESEILSYYKMKTQPNSKVDYINYYKDIKKSKDEDIYKLKKTLKYYETSFGMYTNIPWDGEMLKTTENFPTTRTFVRSVISWFEKNKECLLIIRAHPAEISRKGSKRTETFEELLTSEYPYLPENVIFIPPNSSITSYMISGIVDANILFGSTMSLELAIQKKIVIQGGKNQVSFKNIVFDAHDKNTLYHYIDKVKNKELFFSEEMYENALKYAYYWIKKRHINDTSVVLNKLSFENYTFKNKEEFLKDESLNYITKKIDRKERIVYE